MGIILRKVDDSLQAVDSVKTATESSIKAAGTLHDFLAPPYGTNVRCCAGDLVPKDGAAGAAGAPPAAGAAPAKAAPTGTVPASSTAK